MDTIASETRVSHWNVIFLDRNSVQFAGFYQDPDRPTVLFWQALGLLLGTFQLKWRSKPDDKRRGPLTWTLLRAEQSLYAKGSGQNCDGGVTTRDLDSRDGAMVTPILPGKYYLLKQDCWDEWNNWKFQMVAGAIPRTFREFLAQTQVPSLLGKVDSVSGPGTDRENAATARAKGTSDSVHVQTTTGDSSTECNPPGFSQCLITGMLAPPDQGIGEVDDAMCRSVLTIKAHPIVPASVLVTLFADQAEAGDNQITMSSYIHDFFAAGSLTIDPTTGAVHSLAPAAVTRFYHTRKLNLKSFYSQPLNRALIETHYLQSLHATITARSMPVKTALKLKPWQVNLITGIIGASKSLATQDATLPVYCTQKCLLGLKKGLAMDSSCPNVRRHIAWYSEAQWTAQSKHPVSQETLVQLVQEQLKHDQEIYFQRPEPSTKGHHGQLFQITIVAFGYNFVGKGVLPQYQHKLSHENRIYTEMEELQGTCVPVCLGAFALQTPLRGYDEYDDSPQPTHMMLLSFAGAALEVEGFPNEDLSVDDLIVATEEIQTFKDINAAGVLRVDRREKHQFWNEELQRVFFIDFEKDHLRPATGGDTDMDIEDKTGAMGDNC